MKKRLGLALAVIFLCGFSFYFFQLPKKAESSPEIEFLPKAITTATQPPGIWQIHNTFDINQIKKNTPVTYQFTIINPNQEVEKNFDVVHEKLLHLILVRKDLSYFDHIHPSFIEETGTFTVTLTFPETGEYRLFADFTHQGSNHVVWQDILVEQPSETTPLKPNNSVEVKQGDYTITYNFPEIIRTNTPISYSLSVTKKGDPITKFETYLGAKGHSVIIKENTLEYIHAHADEFDLQFATSFPSAGIYKLFTQFQYEGNIITVPYVIEVQDDTKPKKIIDAPGLHIHH